MKRIAKIVLAPWNEKTLEAQQCVYREVEVETDDDRQLRVLAVSIENDMQMAKGSFDSSGTIVDWHEIDDLVGKLLTYVDATYSDKEQREAHKSIVRDTVWKWFNHNRTHGEKTIDYTNTRIKELAAKS